MITPTIGRVVWFYPTGVSHEAQPLPALICRVWNDSMINVGGFDGDGKPFAATSVFLNHDGYGNPGGGPWATWMPYQKGQAAKTEAVEAKLAESGAA